VSLSSDYQLKPCTCIRFSSFMAHASPTSSCLI
jgi:hypothetical protein